MEENLGPQVTQVNVMAAAADQHCLYVALGGVPGQFAVIDRKRGVLTEIHEMSGTHGSYGMLVSSDGSVFVGGQPNGELFRYEDGTLESVGRAPGDATFIWGLAEDRQGRLCGGTYPGAGLFAWDPASRRMTSLGQAAAGQDYVRSVAVSPATGHLYAGTGTVAGLVRMDLRTGEKRHILPEEGAGTSFVYTLMATGGRIFAHLDPGGRVLVLDEETLETEHVITGFLSGGFSKVMPGGSRVFYTGESGLCCYDIKLGRAVETGVEVGGKAQALVWVEEHGSPKLQLITQSGNMALYDPHANRAALSQAELPGQPAVIQSIHAGPGGRIYSSGYPCGGVGAYDPADNSHEEYTGIGQAENITSMGARMYFGVYPEARIYEFDTAEPWDMAAGNPRLVASLAEWGQDRPFGMAADEARGKLYAGTVPGYGKLGGAFSILDVASGRLTVHQGLIPDQSIITLAIGRDGLVYGGSSVWGGLGVRPAAREAHFFAWDPVSSSTALDIVPVPGKRAITAVATAPNGSIWGWAEGVLFVYDPDCGRIVERRELVPLDYSSASHVWRDARMEFAADGNLYGTINARLFRLEPGTFQLEWLSPAPRLLLAQGRDGALYCTYEENLYRHRLAGH